MAKVYGCLGPGKFGYKHPGNPLFAPGNRLVCKENLSPDSHERRMKGLYKTWAVNDLRHRGEKTAMPVRQKTRERSRLRENLQAEARDIQNLARTLATEAIEAMGEIVRDSEKGSDRIAAAALILERAYGKANQTTINANIDANGRPTEVTSKELDTRIAETLKRVENLTGREAETEPSEERPVDLRISDRDTGGSSIH